MATSKLLKPTNVTISIPEFTDQPDQRVNSNCIDKSADAINTLSEQMANYKYTTINSQDGKQHLQLAKIGKMVFAKLYIETPSLTNSNLDVAVPSGYRPNASISSVCASQATNNGATNVGMILFSTSGLIQYYGQAMPASVTISWTTCFAFWETT